MCHSSTNIDFLFVLGRREGSLPALTSKPVFHMMNHVCQSKQCQTVVLIILSRMSSVEQREQAVYSFWCRVTTDKWQTEPAVLRHVGDILIMEPNLLLSWLILLLLFFLCNKTAV